MGVITNRELQKHIKKLNEELLYTLSDLNELEGVLKDLPPSDITANTRKQLHKLNQTLTLVGDHIILSDLADYKVFLMQNERTKLRGDAI